MSEKLYVFRVQENPEGQPIAGALIHAESPNGEWNGRTDPCGHFMPTLADGRYVLTVSAPGFVTREAYEINLADAPKAPILIGLDRGTDRPSVPVGTSPEIHGRLRSQGPRLFDDQGPWKWKMATAFDLLRLFIVGGSEAITPYLLWVRSLGGNGVRVFANWQVTGLDFRQVPNYLAYVTRLAERTRSLGLRMELCAVCDYIPAGLEAQQQFIDALAAAVAPFASVALTFGNEPYQNMEDPQRIVAPAVDCLLARGMCNPNDPHALPYLPSAGFTVYETVRSDDWMRKVGKDGYEIRNGFGDFPGTQDACINTEMIGAAETYQPGRRSNRPDEFFMAGIAAALFTSGATAHGDSHTMQACQIPGPIEAACVAALFRGIDLVPIDAPTWTYTRRGPSHPAEPMPVESDPIDAEDEERIHAMVGPADAVAVNYRYLLPGHDAWRPQGVNGWRAVEQVGPYVRCVR